MTPGESADLVFCLIFLVVFVVGATALLIAHLV